MITQLNRIKKYLKTNFPNIYLSYRKFKINHPAIFSNYSEFRSKSLAMENAAGAKRLDICAAEIAYAFHMTGFSGKYPLKEKICLEVGSGWVLTHSIIFYLLGAKKIISTDYVKLAHPEYIHHAIQNYDLSQIRDILSPFEDHSVLRSRLNKLKGIKKFDFHLLKTEFGIEYIAPIDLARDSLHEKIDFCYSGSVLEHVTTNEIMILIQNLSACLNTNGFMFHFIHLEDHDNLDEPFKFYEIPEKVYDLKMQLERGNRIRMSQWLKLFNEVKSLDHRIIHAWKRTDKEMPKTIDPSIIYESKEDLITSHIAIMASKKK